MNAETRERLRRPRVATNNVNASTKAGESLKILILGGTAFFGKETARIFSEAGRAVTLFTRGDRKPSDLPACAHITGDRNDDTDLQKAAGTQWDLVIDNIAYNGDHVRKALAAFRNAGHYFLTSTVSVYRYSHPRMVQPLRKIPSALDSTPPAQDLKDIHWSYANGKWEAEKALRSQRAIEWTIFRPTVVHGPGDPLERGFWYIARMLKGGPLLLPNSGAASFVSLYSIDIARAYLQASQAGAHGKTYNLAQSEIITLRDYVEESARALGIDPDLVNVPRDLLAGWVGPTPT